eukprot:XP_011665196.1 PREDICTED: dipeptidase 1-like [Strongylocentrotus purpuratus]
MASLRMLYELGVRYMTVTHSCNTPWADNWLMDDETNPEHNGLTAFGKDVVREMNRLGMLVDLSHVSVKTMNDALDLVTAPVMFSHTSAYELCNHYRNAPNSILTRVKANGGVVMVNFYTKYINCPPANVTADDNYATLGQVAVQGKKNGSPFIRIAQQAQSASQETFYIRVGFKETVSRLTGRRHLQKSGENLK